MKLPDLSLSEEFLHLHSVCSRFLTEFMNTLTQSAIKTCNGLAKHLSSKIYGLYRLSFLTRMLKITYIRHTRTVTVIWVMRWSFRGNFFLCIFIVSFLEAISLIALPKLPQSLNRNIRLWKSRDKWPSSIVRDGELEMICTFQEIKSTRAHRGVCIFWTARFLACFEFEDWAISKSHQLIASSCA